MATKNLTVALCRLLVACGVLLTITTGRGYAQSILYDDFESGELSPVKWSAQASGAEVLEIAREVRSGQLAMSHRVLGNRTISTGQISSSNTLNFEEGQNFTALRFNVVVRDVSVVGCPEGAISRAFAGFLGTLFEDNTGDMGAFLYLERRSDSEDPPDLLHAIAGMFRCRNNSCSDIRNVDLGTVTTGEQVVLRMIWDEPNKEIRFRKNQEKVVRVSYRRDAVVRHSSRALRVWEDVANCADGPQPEASMRVFFDNVFITP